MPSVAFRSKFQISTSYSSWGLAHLGPKTGGLDGTARPLIFCNTVAGSFQIERTVITFDTSVIGAGTTINDANISINLGSILDELSPAGQLCLCSYTGADTSGSALWNDFSFTLLSNDIVSLSDPAVFHLNATGIAAINKTGITRFGVILYADFTNTSPPYVQFKSQAAYLTTVGSLQYNVATPPADPSLLTSACVSNIGETTLPGSPIASFTANAVSGLSPLTVNFTDTSTGTPISWLWEFGDGATSTAHNPSHVFATGTWIVRLTATNAQGFGIYQMTIIAYATLPMTPPDNGIVVPGGSFTGDSIQSLLGKIGYYAVDTDGNQVKIYGLDGALLKTFGGIGSIAGKFYRPTTCSVINGRQLIDRVVIDQQ